MTSTQLWMHAGNLETKGEACDRVAWGDRQKQLLDSLRVILQQLNLQYGTFLLGKLLKSPDSMLAFILIQHIDKTSYMSIYVLKITESVRRSKNCNKVYFAKHECTCSNLLTLVSLLFFLGRTSKMLWLFRKWCSELLRESAFRTMWAKITWPLSLWFRCWQISGLVWKCSGRVLSWMHWLSR